MAPSMPLSLGKRLRSSISPLLSMAQNVTVASDLPSISKPKKSVCRQKRSISTIVPYIVRIIAKKTKNSYLEGWWCNDTDIAGRCICFVLYLMGDLWVETDSIPLLQTVTLLRDLYGDTATDHHVNLLPSPCMG